MWCLSSADTSCNSLIGLRRCERAWAVDIDDGCAVTHSNEDIVNVVAALQYLATMDRPARKIRVIPFPDLERLLAVVTPVNAYAPGKHVHDTVVFGVMMPLTWSVERR